MKGLRSFIENKQWPMLRVASVSLSVVLTGCATTGTAPVSVVERSTTAGQSCVAWFVKLDAAIDSAGVHDAGAYRIPGFPYLRIDRFSASFREEARNNVPEFNAWLAHLEALDAKAREIEIGNLPARSFPIEGLFRETTREKTRTCATALASDDFTGAANRNLLIDRAPVPDSYADWKREVGLYPIASIPFAQGVEAWHKEASNMFRKTAAETQPPSDVARYATAAGKLTASEVAAVLEHAQKDALGIPRYSNAEREILLRAYAPAYEIETTGRFDRFGPLIWRDGPAPEIDISHPLLYRRLEFTRFHDRVLTQLVYTIWFPERPPSGAIDMLAGRLDGVVFRVTLGEDGAPLVYDTIHPCGCYHMFFPTARVSSLPAADPSVEWAFAPETLPALAGGQRVVVRIQSRTHYIVGVRPDNGAPGIAYQVADDDELRVLPTASGTTRSAFGPDGIVPGTERGERYVFWPMGIANSGAMRQWGNHATAFIGRRHFDDADLIEQRFGLVTQATTLSRNTQ
jgi:hypothetical protein